MKFQSLIEYILLFETEITVLSEEQLNFLFSKLRELYSTNEDTTQFFRYQTVLDYILEQIENGKDTQNIERLYEVALDDYISGKAIKLDNAGKWYMDKHGKTIRHAKIIFQTHNLQRSICKEYINHDPTNIQDKCIEVLLCRPNGYDKWLAISTLRKMEPRCIKQHPLTYAVVPPRVFERAVKNMEIPEDDKVKILELYKKAREKLSSKPEFQKRLEKLLTEKPVIVRSEKDIGKLITSKGEKIR
jgi:hypothetical protein